MDEARTDLALSPYRALDLTDEKGFICGKILGDLGADVIKIEKPGGEPSRSIGPFYKDIPDPEKSLHWFAYNSNKRSITLDIETEDGKDIFKKLVKTADFVIESFPVGYMDRTGLGYSVLSAINPGIIMTSISHFGDTGPYKDYKGCDIVDMAMGGYMFLCGDPDRPPVRISAPQAYNHAGAEAAAGTMIAFHHRQMTGKGQYVSTSVQQSLVRLQGQAAESWDINHSVLHRMGHMREGFSAGNVIIQQTWPCKDGAVNFAIFGGMAGARTNQNLVAWMDEEGMADDFIKEINWPEFDISVTSQETFDRIMECLNRFFMTHTHEELYEEAARRRIMLYPVATTKDIVENRQLAERDYWQDVEYPELGDTIRCPGPFLKSTEMRFNIRRRAPLIGEHNDEVYREMGISPEELIILKQGNII